jgi:hypothetical protein
MAAPRIIVVNAEVVRRKPRLLAFLGLALPDGSSRWMNELIEGESVPATWHWHPRTGSITQQLGSYRDRRSRDSLCEIWPNGACRSTGHPASYLNVTT